MDNINEKELETQEVNSLLMEGEDSIMEDVNAINNLIESEKRKQSQEKNVEKKVSPIKKSAGATIRKVEQKIEVVEEEMERLHLRVFEDTIDILYRPNHCYIAFVPNNEDGMAEVKRVAEMTREDFLAYLKKSTCFRFNTRAELDSIKTSSAETWYKGAWSMTTKKIFEELGIVNPVEKPYCR